VRADTCPFLFVTPLNIVGALQRAAARCALIACTMPAQAHATRLVQEPVLDILRSRGPHRFVRQWVPAPTKIPKGVASGMRLRVLSYNILSDTIRQETAFLFRDVNDPACSWPRRMDLILREIAHYEADIIGMQVCTQCCVPTVLEP
jgi:hypothetical protein